MICKFKKGDIVKVRPDQRLGLPSWSDLRRAYICKADFRDDDLSEADAAVFEVEKVEERTMETVLHLKADNIRFCSNASNFRLST